MADGAVDLLFQTTGSGVMNVSPEADAFGIEMFFDFVNESAVRVAVGNEEW